MCWGRSQYYLGILAKQNVKIAKHQQFLPSMTVKVVSVENYATEVEDEVFNVYSDDDNDDNDDKNKEGDDNGDDDNMAL